MPTESTEPHRRRTRYAGNHPRSFAEKYKELNPRAYSEDVERVLARGDTPAGSHRSICVREIMEVLSPESGELAVDATLGYGGHTMELLRAVLPGGRVYGLDRDPLELEKTRDRIRTAGFADESFRPRHMNFSRLRELLDKEGLPGVDVVLADLGLSSMQIDNPERGFTYKRDGPLDMRMDPSSGTSAADLLLSISERELRSMIEDHSDEPEARAIARVLTQRRGRVRTTGELAEAVRDALQGRLNTEEETWKTIQRTFQALRIEVNSEFRALESLLEALPACVKAGGRIAILAFHSGEGGRIERSFRKGFEAGLYSAFSEEPLRPGREERFDNPRSSSARLWWARRNAKRA